jgi:hypothetical protein
MRKERESMSASGDGGNDSNGRGDGLSELIEALRGQRQRTGGQQAIIDEHAELKKALAGPRLASVGPTISGFEPPAGPPGTKLKITGTRLADATLVRIGSTRVTSFSRAPTPTSLEVTVPATTTSGEVSVFTPLGVATSEQKFNVVQTASKTGT